jgi:hypothetical protein
MNDSNENGSSVSAPLNFIRRQDKKPVFHSAALTGGLPKIFFETEAHTVAIADMRPIAGSGNQRSVGSQAGHALTFKLDHSSGADQLRYFASVHRLEK